jgi:hypothetical protein
MSKITYLFGAGASRQALPIVNEIPKHLRAIIDLFSHKDYELEDILFPDLSEQNRKTKKAIKMKLLKP